MQAGVDFLDPLFQLVNLVLGRGRRLACRVREALQFLFLTALFASELHASRFDRRFDSIGSVRTLDARDTACSA